MLRHAWWIALLLTSSGAWALDPDRLLSQFDRTTWTAEDGLPQSSVLSIAQTPDGFLWLATLGGLVRFDGMRFETTGPEQGLPSGWATAVAVDAHGRLWVMSAGGLHRQHGGGFVPVSINGSDIRGANAMVPRTAGGMWVASNDAVHWLDGEGAGHELVDETGASLGNVMAGATDGAYVCFASRSIDCAEDDEASRAPTVAHRIADEALPTRSLAFDAEGALWVGTDGAGIHIWPRAHHVGARFGPPRQVGSPDGKTLAILVDRRGSVWFTDAPGVLGRLRDERPVPPLSLGIIRSLFEDRAGNLWVGTNTRGLVRLSERGALVFSTPEGLPSSSVLCVIETDDGTLWLGVEGGGLVAVVDGRIVGEYDATHGLENVEVHALAQDRDGRLLVGTARGVFVGPPPEAGRPMWDRPRFIRLAPTERPVFALHRDGSGGLWGGFYRELRRLGPEGFEPTGWSEGSSVLAITESADGTLWFAGEGGLLRLRDGRPAWIGDDEPGPKGTVITLLDDTDGLWLGTLNTGLGFLSHDGTYRTLGRQDGLCDDMVFSILDDRDGHLWMSSNRGVFAVDKAAAQTALAAPHGEKRVVSCRLLTRADGLRNPEANGGLQPSAWRGRDGRLWFATIDGAVAVEPHIIEPRMPPPMALDRVEAGERTWPGAERDRVILTPDERDFAITYTGLDLTRPESLQFRYRLLGFKDAWVEANTRRTAYFTHRAPGRYVFEAAARVGEDGPWGEPARLTIELKPLFSETTLFAALVGLTIIGSLATAYRWRVAGIRRRQADLERAVAARTTDLEEARQALQDANVTLQARVEDGVAALRQRDRMAAYGRLVAGVVHELRHPIFSLQTVAHLLRAKLGAAAGAGDELDLLGRETGRMKRLLDDLLDMARPDDPVLLATDVSALLDEVVASHTAASTSRGRTSIPVRLVVEPSLPAVDGEREKLAQVLLNLLDNACRHAVGATEIVLSASSATTGDEPPWLRITVADDGAGVDDAVRSSLFEPFVSGTQGTGLGLGLAIARATIDAHGGTIRLVPGAVGTVFEIHLPSKQATDDAESDHLARPC